MLINDAPAHAQRVAVRVPGRAEVATIERLAAPSLGATTGVKIGGQTFGAHTMTGVPSGREDLVSLAPVAGEYVMRMPAASAALLTIP